MGREADNKTPPGKVDWPDRELLPKLTEVFGWTEAPAGPNSPRTAVFNAEMALAIDPVVELARIIETAGRIREFAAKRYSNPAVMITAIASEPDLLNSRLGVSGCGPLLTDERGEEETRTAIAAIYQGLKIDTILKGLEPPLDRDAILGLALLAPMRLHATLLNCGFPTPVQWRDRQNAIIKQNWHSAARGEFAALQRPSLAHDLTPETVLEYQREQQRVRTELDRRLAALAPPPKPALPARPLRGVTAGLEIEAFFINEVPPALGKKYIKLAFEKLGLRVGPSDWWVKEDATIKKHEFDCANTHPEVTTPVLEGTEAERQIRLGMHALKALGCGVNNSCGLHANVGHRDGLDLAQAKAVLLNYAANQDKFDTLVPIERRGVGKYFAPPWTTVGKTRPGAHPELIRELFEQVVQECTTLEELTSRTGCVGPETSVNLGKLELGYVEMRQGAGTLDAEVALDWLRVQADVVRSAVHKPGQRLNLGYLRPGAELGDGFVAPLANSGISGEIAIAERFAKELEAATSAVDVAAPTCA